MIDPKPTPHPTESARPRFGLIIIGDEILSGKRSDKHLPKVIELLKQRGLSLDYAEYVGDARGMWCFRPVASVPRRTTTPVSVLLEHSGGRWCFIPKPRS